MKMRAFVCLAVLALASGCSSSSSEDEAASQAQSSFVDPSVYADLVTLRPEFPYGVTQRRDTTGAVLGARWGRHGGPQLMMGSGEVRRWEATGATFAPAAAALPSGLPTPHFWSVDGLVDTASGAIRAYSTSAGVFSGEVFFHDASYARIDARAFANGYYSGIGAADGIVYSGLSGLTETASTTNDNGLWYATGHASGCAQGCTSTKIFGWDGFSGPVVSDADGNVFVAGFVPSGTPRSIVFALPKAKIAHAATTPATVAEVPGIGASTFAAIGTPGSGKGWIVGKDHDGDAIAPSWARAYRTTADGIVADGAVLADPIHLVSNDAAVTYFADPEGHLWLAIEKGDEASFLELAPRP